MSPLFFHQRLIDFPPQFIARAHTLSQVAISFVSEDVDISPNFKRKIFGPQRRTGTEKEHIRRIKKEFD